MVSKNWQEETKKGTLGKYTLFEVTITRLTF